VTQTASAPPATRSPVVPQAAAPGLPTPPPAQRQQLGRVAQLFEGTPGRMRALLIVTAVFSVIFGLAAAQGFNQSDGALTRAEANTAQLVRIQAIHTNLVSANADATNSFLVGGLEPPAQRQHFTDAMTTAAKLISEAATAQPADQKALGELNVTLLTYQGLIEQARANNRQGLPLGSQYLKDASATLQEDSLPLLNALVDSNQARVDTEFNGVSRGNIWLILGGLLALIVLGFALWWLAKRTHRWVNVPVAAAAALVLLTMVIGGASLAGASSSAKDTRKNAYADTLALSQARISAYDAKSNESLTLIARGSGTKFEEDWKAAANTTGDRLRDVSNVAPGLGSAWDNYRGVHVEIRKSDDRGSWDEAVDQAIGSAEGSSNRIFKAFDDQSAGKLADLSAQARSELTSARDGLPPIGWLGLPIGIAAALLAAWGFTQRLEEYR
jgi:CHASE3 domain sensor protein